MYRALILWFLMSTAAMAQTTPSVPPAPSPVPDLPSAPSQPLNDLPDAPSAIAEQQQDVVAINHAIMRAQGKKPGSCDLWHAAGLIYVSSEREAEQRPPCSELVYPYQRFLSTNVAIPLNWKEKGYLAIHYTTDPAGLGTIVGISAINIAVDSHTAYGPGLKGFGKLAGVSVLQNATAEFFGTFAVPALAHQDPRYYRMPHMPFRKRFLYSVTRSYVSRSDDGHTIPNYGTLSAYPIVAELSNFYVPGIESDGLSTTKRIITGLALDPVNNLVNEFLPDVARHVHVRIIFVQQILNNIAYSQGGLP
ncbi:MAG TPA: hypothetical protein VL495_04790 [Edaphobacter sp.]|jgi:hypothetical protein|nr:hypothetical protein [Edaphobacter sp.]